MTISISSIETLHNCVMVYNLLSVPFIYEMKVVKFRPLPRQGRKIGGKRNDAWFLPSIQDFYMHWYYHLINRQLMTLRILYAFDFDHD